MTTVTNPTKTNAVTLIEPTEIASPQLVELVRRYMRFAKGSAQNILELAKTLSEAKEKLKKDELGAFCRDVGLNPKSSTYRKLTFIGDNAARFEPYIENMPSAWTTVYKLAMLPDADFDLITKSDKFSPFMTASSITKLVSPDKKASPKASIIIVLTPLSEPERVMLRHSIEELQKRFKFEMHVSGKCPATDASDEDASEAGEFQLEQAA